MLKMKSKYFFSAVSLCLFSIFLILFFVNPVLGNITEPANPPGIESPFKDPKMTLIGLLNLILRDIVLPIGAVIAVLASIFTGFLFVTAQGNEDKLKTAKKSLTWTVVGIAVLLGALVISEGIKNTICLISDIPGLECPKK